jgi:hypothetical protein
MWQGTAGITSTMKSYELFFIAGFVWGFLLLQEFGCHFSLLGILLYLFGLFASTAQSLHLVISLSIFTAYIYLVNYISFYVSPAQCLLWISLLIHRHVRLACTRGKTQMSVNTHRTTQSNISEDRHLHTCHHEKLKACRRYVRFEVLILVKLSGVHTVFASEDGSSMFLRNSGIFLQVHKTLQPKRPTSTWRRLFVIRLKPVTCESYLKEWNQFLRGGFVMLLLH